MVARKRKAPPPSEGNDDQARPQASADSLTRRIPALASYIERVGAEEINFRKFMIKEYNETRRHYYTERAFIWIDADGVIHASKEEYEPTQIELAAIQAAMIDIKLPKSVRAPKAAALRKMEELDAEIKAWGLEGRTFAFPSRKDGKVTMLQQTYRHPKSGKQYIPYTMWSDGEWRRMEPDQKLPIWKPFKPRDKAKLMIHEGAKAAAFLDELLFEGDEERKHSHPWWRELEDYEHWGLIGGALAPHRTEYGEIVSESYGEVVYVCDNDFPGNAALQEVSKQYGKSLFGVRFGKDFKESFDLADPMPEKFFKKGRWTGPSLKDLVEPATWATETLPNPGGKGKKVHVLTKAFREQWLHALTPEVFVHRNWPHQLFNAQEFNSKVAPFSHLDDTARLVRKDNASKSAVIKYDPSKEPGVYGSSDEGMVINTYKKPNVQELEGDPKPWLDFMSHLIPDPKDRHELFRWIATLVARPDIRMKYGVLLISETQGVGKGTLAEGILTPLIGKINVSSPSESDITESQFNYWMSHKRLAIVHEIYAGHSWKAYNRLKSIISEDIIHINRKHMATYQIDNWMHIFACSNSLKALRLDQSDRRWYLPRVREEKRSTKFWIDFYGWLQEDGGLGIIKRWCREFIEEHGPVLKGEDAPWSSLKQEVVEASDSPGEEIVRTALRRVSSILSGDAEDAEEKKEEWKTKGMLVDGKVALLDVRLVRLIQEVLYQGRRPDFLEKPLTVRKLAKSEGWFVGDTRVSTGMRSWGLFSVNGRIISNCQKLAKTNPTELAGTKVNERPKIMPLDLEFLKEM